MLCAMVSVRSVGPVPAISPSNPVARMARPVDAPINPVPTMRMRRAIVYTTFRPTTGANRRSCATSLVSCSG